MPRSDIAAWATSSHDPLAPTHLLSSPAFHGYQIDQRGAVFGRVVEHEVTNPGAERTTTGETIAQTVMHRYHSALRQGTCPLQDDGEPCWGDLRKISQNVLHSISNLRLVY